MYLQRILLDAGEGFAHLAGDLAEELHLAVPGDGGRVLLFVGGVEHLVFQR